MNVTVRVWDKRLASAAALALNAMGKDVHKATVYLSERCVVSLCRRFKHDARNSREDMVLKVGAPNYAQRNFIKLCKRAHVRLPLRRPQLTFYREKR